MNSPSTTPEEWNTPYPPRAAGPDGGTLVAWGMLIFFGFVLLRGTTTTWGAANPLIEASPAGVSVPLPDPLAVAAPYKKFVLTQGPHGASYGHMAIDLAAGKGTPVLSPIDGTVTALYTDQWGNPTLIIENEVFQAMLLHGDYTVQVGDELRLGDPVGTESNQGYTTDMNGVSCAGRNCGYHTHFNLFDKRTGQNANPLDWIEVP